MLQQPTLLERLIPCAHLLSIISDVNTATWFGVKGNDQISLSVKGTRPGDPLADVLFNLQHGPTLADINSDLNDA
eukprot:10822857-Karenia_brevis.AAC.1